MEHFLLRGLWNANGPPGDEVELPRFGRPIFDTLKNDVLTP